MKYEYKKWKGLYILKKMTETVNDFEGKETTLSLTSVRNELQTAVLDFTEIKYKPMVRDKHKEWLAEKIYSMSVFHFHI